MKPIGKKIMLEAQLGQKESITITGEGGKKIELWLGKKYVENHRQKSPVIGKVLGNNSPDFPYIKEGDLLLVHHNYLADPEQNQFCIEYFPEENRGIFSIPADRNIFCRLNPDGTVDPICHNLLCERLKNPIQSSVIIIPDTVKQEHNDRVKVVKTSPEVQSLYAGQTVLIMKMADYEICYTWAGKEYSVIKIWEEEVIGVLN